MSTYDLEENRNNARLSTTSSSKANSNNQNDEESIFLSSSSDNDEIENVYAKKSKKYSSVNDVEYDDEDYEDDEPQSDNDNSFYDEDSGSRRRPIKVYDEYDPENIDDDDDYLSANNNNSKTRGRRNQMPYSPEAYQNITSDSSLSSNDSFSNNKRHSNSDNTNESSNDGDNDVRSNKKMINKVKKLAQSKPVSSSAKTAPKKIKKEDISSTNSTKTSKTSKMIKLGTKSASITLKPTTTATIETSESSILTTGSKIINLSSGFKIPKRSSNETSAEVNAPPEKKAKISSSSNLDQGSKSNNKSSNSSSNIKQTNNKSSTNNNNNNNKNTTKSSNSSTSKKPTVTASPKSSKSSSNQTKNELIESNFFMEALNTSTKSHTKSSKSKENNFKHKETSNNSNNTENKAKSDENKTNNSLTSVANSSEFNKPDLAQINNNYNKLLENNRIDNKVNLTEPSASSSSSASSKKKVTWADSYSKQLEQIQHFYLDEDEKSSKKIAFNSLKDFGKIEKLNEKEMMRFKMMSNETGVIDQFGKTDPSSQADNTNPNNIPWVLHTCDLPESTVKVEINSIEHEIQLKREQNTLAFMVFKQFLPDSPIEPTDTSISDPTITTKPIPLDDITHFHDTNNTSNDYIDTHENSMNKKTISFTDHQKRQNEMVKSNSIPPTQTASTTMPSQLSSISSLFNLSQPKETPPVITLPTPNLDLDKINSLIKNEHELKKILSTFNNNNPSQTTNSTPDTLNTLINSTKSVAIDSNTNKFNNNNNNNNKSQVQQTRWGSPPRSSNNNNNNNTNTNNNSNNNNNNTKTSWQQNNNNSNKFQQNEYRKPYNNTNNTNNNNNNNSNKPNNFNDSNPNGRNLFQNSFKRGIGNRSNGGGTFRNNDSDNFNRGGNGFNNRSSNNNFNQNNRNRFNGFNKNYSNNDSDQSNANTTPTSTTNTTPTATTSTTSQQGGRWI
jgi:hypothetical protein